MQKQRFILVGTMTLFLVALAAGGSLLAGDARSQRSAAVAAATGTPYDWACANEIPVMINVGWMTQAQAQAWCAQRTQFLAQHPPTPAPAGMPTPCPSPTPSSGPRVAIMTACAIAFRQAFNQALGATVVPGVTMVGAYDSGVTEAHCTFLTQDRSHTYQYTNAWSGALYGVCAGSLTANPQQGVVAVVSNDSYVGEYQTQYQDGALRILSGNGDSAAHHMIILAGEPPPTPPASISPTGADVLQLAAADGATYSFDVAQRLLTRTGRPSATATPAAGP